MTIQEAMSWCDGQIGQSAEDTQGLRLLNLYYQFLTGRNPHADGVPLVNAKAAWSADPAGFTKVYNDPNDTSQLPPPGSIIFTEETIALVNQVAYNLSAQPVLGWWVWDGFAEPPVPSGNVRIGDPEPISGVQPPRRGSTYIWVQGDTIWRVAPRFGLRAAELLEHNCIADWHSIRPGDAVHLPVRRPIVPDYELAIEVLDQHRPMHTVQPGVRKVSFGHLKSFDILPPVGPHLPPNARQLIAAIAHIRIRDERRDFYMDTVSLGDYAATKRVRYTVGFQRDDLDDGYVSARITEAVVGWSL